MSNAYLNIAIRAARKAGNLIAKAYERKDEIQVTEKALNDFVTNVDKAAEQTIIEVIKNVYPTHSILAEESGLLTSTDSNIVWIIDPLDGTTNFINGLPHFSVSIAVQVDNKIEVGVVYDPIRNEIFSAIRGKGAQLDEKRLRINNLESKTTVITTGFARRNSTNYKVILPIVEKLLADSIGLRITGSAALDLSYLAANRIHAFFQMGLKPWDIAAGELIVREAGGICCDFDGSNNYFESGNIVAGSSKLIKYILQNLG